MSNERNEMHLFQLVDLLRILFGNTFVMKTSESESFRIRYKYLQIFDRLGASLHWQSLSKENQNE